MPVRTAKVEWQGNLIEGRGTMELGSGTFKGNYNFGSRFQEGPGTNPEELIGAAYAGCYSMALAQSLHEGGYEPRTLHTTARVTLEQLKEGYRITSVHLETRGEVPDVDEQVFKQHAEEAKNNCPVSQALKIPKTTVEARLEKQPIPA
ncbi:MAG: OsmC family peroxiredoxin [Candidatus Zixiibacteriota bacterium]|nr:MAG: OsmC family peroxiredoxin [candidate division Zixibacteria bacterium]